MPHPLRRILRFRQLAEEQSRLEVEQASQMLRCASLACEEQIAIVHRQRSLLAESWVPETVDGVNACTTSGEDISKIGEQISGGNSWFIEEAALKISSLRRTRLEQIREAETRRIEPMIDRYKERRRELRQTEKLLAQQTAIENLENDRRMQAETDEWFLRRGHAGRRKTRRQEHVLSRSETSEEEIPPKC